ncbi:MBL fold metallo-hydrolase [uncultured Friedmanniella sp.]|uniref:MBL fold metallo-hydrolase n=1 Tax=uncultured Friedmanniella sp. TaxID=335381 RepID=UPI0035C9B486
MSPADPGRPGYVRLVRAPNPGPMTLEGTNTWLVGDPDEGPPVVVDPGPAIAAHLDAVLAAAGGRLAGVILTHRHADHSEGAAELAGRAGCGVRALDPTFQRGPDGLPDGAVIVVGSVSLTVHHTPGHTSDSCSLLLRGRDGTAWLLTGDTVLGRGTTVITHPDGDLGAYLGSLDRLQRLVSEERVVALLPGHGPPVDDPVERLEHYVRHRRQRLAEVRAALADGARTPAEVVDRVYVGLDPSVRPAAEQSVRAQLHYLSSLSPGS